MTVFCAQSELKFLDETEYVICDGTFEMSPTSAYQLYILHGLVNDEGMALLWALLPGKNTDTYNEMFSALRQALENSLGDVRKPKTFLVDFEQAAIQSIRSVFPEARVKGCSFHFIYRQAIMRKIQNIGLKNVYDNGDDYPQVKRYGCGGYCP